MLAAAEPMFDPVLVDRFMLGVGALLIFVLFRELRNAPAKLLVLMMTAFVDMAGLFIIIPLVPFYVVQFHENGETLFGLQIQEGFLTGLVVTSFTVAQLFTAPFWGRFSDRFGRRPALLIALSASAIAYLLFGLADSLWLLLLSRVVQGAGGGLVGVIQAYVADTVEPQQRAQLRHARFPVLPGDRHHPRSVDGQDAVFDAALGPRDPLRRLVDQLQRVARVLRVGDDESQQALQAWWSLPVRL